MFTESRFRKLFLRFILGFLHRFKSVNGFSLVRTAVYRIHIFRVPGFFRRRLLGASMWRLVCCADGHLLDTIKQIFSAWFCIPGISAGDYGAACVHCASMWWLFCCADCHVPDTIKQIFRHSFASWVFPSVSDPGFFPGSGSGSDLFSESGSGSWSAKIRILSGKIRIRILEKNVLKLGYWYK